MTRKLHLSTQQLLLIHVHVLMLKGLVTITHYTPFSPSASSCNLQIVLQTRFLKNQAVGKDFSAKNLSLMSLISLALAGVLLCVRLPPKKKNFNSPNNKVIHVQQEDTNYNQKKKSHERRSLQNMVSMWKVNIYSFQLPLDKLFVDKLECLAPDVSQLSQSREKSPRKMLMYVDTNVSKMTCVSTYSSVQ